MLTKNQLALMLALQNKMNEKVNPTWLGAGYAYLRAAMIESVEAIEHHGWKWWKAQARDDAQLQMELVDIWHFALSDCIIRNNGNIENAAQAIEAEISDNALSVVFDGVTYLPTERSLLDNLELMAGLCAAKRFSVALFMQIVNQSGMTSDELYRQYVGKNVLNFFRQDHGYKAGTYVKIWHGKEDNEVLVEILNALDVNDPDYSDKIYAGLLERYPQ